MPRSLRIPIFTGKRKAGKKRTPEEKSELLSQVSSSEKSPSSSARNEMMASQTKRRSHDG